MSGHTIQIAPSLKHALAASPDAQFYLLVRVSQADDQTEQVLLAYGATIRQRLTLLPTFAITCTGATALSLLECPFVQRIEDDRPVHTM